MTVQTIKTTNLVKMSQAELDEVYGNSPKKISLGQNPGVMFLLGILIAKSASRLANDRFVRD